MSTKVRKQIYLEQRQNRQLKRLAEARGVSEAAVIRELIDAEGTVTAAKALPPDRAAWEAIVEFSRQRAKSGVTGEPYKWNRDEIYEERQSRFGPLITDAQTGDKAPTKTPNPPVSKAKPRPYRRGHATKKRRYAAGLD
jgi:hypothetical protein